jgi:uncharacterized protein YndB with AHSA1/START domain
MRKLEMSWVFDRPPEEVWKFVTNMDIWANAAISGGEWRHTPEGPLALGTTIDSCRKIFGRTRKLHHYVVTEFEPFRVFGMTDKFPGFPLMSGRYTFEATPEGTRVTRSAELDFGRSPGRLLEPALHWLTRRTWPIEAANMRRLIEAG